eukprot:XP_001693073.1 predicted protein [Chlamydomonas reinhardtii]
MYESMLFLFVTHPYDVGDCILVGVGADMYRVKKISLLYTDLVKSNGERVYMPNTALITVVGVGPHPPRQQRCWRGGRWRRRRWWRRRGLG